MSPVHKSTSASHLTTYDCTIAYMHLLTSLSQGGAQTTLSPPPQGALQPDGRRIPEAVYDAKHVGEAIVHIASLPLDVTVLTFNIM